jgi:hypothetical protein
MPRPSIDLQLYKAEITTLYQQHLTTAELAKYLYDKYNIKVTSRTIEARFKQWGVYKQNRTARKDDVLHARIKVLFYEVGLEEKELLTAIQEEGWEIQAGTLKSVRHQLGLFRRISSNPVAAQLETDKILNELRDQLSKGQIEGYGRGLLHQHFKSQGLMIAR